MAILFFPHPAFPKAYKRGQKIARDNSKSVHPLSCALIYLLPLMHLSGTESICAILGSGRNLSMKKLF